jgi:hypothetical protein
MVKTILLAVLSFLGAASAVPATTNPIPDNIAEVKAKDPSTFTSYKVGGKILRLHTEENSPLDFMDSAVSSFNDNRMHC